jgi:type II secretory pathway component PulM
MDMIAMIGGETDMATEQLVRVVPATTKPSDKVTMIKQAFEMRDRKKAISDKLKKDWMADMERVTRTLAAQNVERFDFGLFRNTWRPVEERYEQWRSALDSYYRHLEEFIKAYGTENPEELKQVVNEMREKLQKDSEELDELDRWLSSAYSTYSAP